MMLGKQGSWIAKQEEGILGRQAVVENLMLA